jgi:hypothetical protein
MADKPEKRLRRYRANPTIQIAIRIERAQTQSMFLVKTSEVAQTDSGPSITFIILGSTGNAYEVTFSKTPNCSCPDWRRGHLCKHFLFIMLKVVGLSDDSPMVYQSSYLTCEVEGILQQLSERRAYILGSDIIANDAVQRQFLRLQIGKDDESSSEHAVAKRKPFEGDLCPICYDSLGTNVSLLTFCKAKCGTNFHTQCMNKALTSQTMSSDKCPICRETWVGTSTDGSVRRRRAPYGEEEYTNLGSLQGQSRTRDTSTYNPYFDRRYNDE